MSETTYHSTGDMIDYTPGSAAAAGAVVFTGLICGQVVADLEANQKGALRIEGVISVPKASGTVFAGGALVHWNSTTKLAVASAANGIMGRAVGGGADGQTFVLVRLNSATTVVPA